MIYREKGKWVLKNNVHIYTVSYFEFLFHSDIRLMLHTLMRQNRKCGLCTAVGNNNHTRNEENVVESDMHNFNVTNYTAFLRQFCFQFSFQMTANDSDIYRFRLETGECINDDLLIVSSNNKVD